MSYLQARQMLGVVFANDHDSVTTRMQFEPVSGLRAGSRHSQREGLQT